MPLNFDTTGQLCILALGESCPGCAPTRDAVGCPKWVEMVVETDIAGGGAPEVWRGCWDEMECHLVPGVTGALRSVAAAVESNRNEVIKAVGTFGQMVLPIVEQAMLEQHNGG